VVTGELVTEFDVEDVVRDRALSQAQALEFIAIGNEVYPNAQLPSVAIPSVFKNNGVVLEED